MPDPSSAAGPSPPAGRRPDPAEDALPVGTMLGGCRIDGTLGVGGMGTVYRATQVALEKPVALKVLPKRFAASDEAVERFLREARLAARLEHENIVQVFDTGTEDGRSFIVMQLVEGETLKARLRRAGPLSVTGALELWQQAAQGLAAAHRKRVIHRDVKPENLIVTPDGRLKVADFGLAQEESLDDAGDPIADRVLASASYMSPEHADLQPVDARSDLYSLGVTVWTLLAGRLPRVAESHLEWVLRHGLDQAPPIGWVRRDVPLTVSSILARSMAGRREDRFESADELLDELDAVLQFQPPRTHHLPLAREVAILSVDAASIEPRGLRRCLDIQRTLKQQGDPLLPLGMLMRTNGFVRMTTEPLPSAAALPFVWPIDRPVPSASEHPRGHDDEASPRDIAAVPGHRVADSAPMPAAWRLTRAPVATHWDGHWLFVRPIAPMHDPLAVQHLFDWLLAFPYPSTLPRVRLDLDAACQPGIDDVSWIVGTHNLLQAQGGHLEIRSLDGAASRFLTAHHLTEYLHVRDCTGGLAPVRPRGGDSDPAPSGAMNDAYIADQDATDPNDPAAGVPITGDDRIAVADEARSLLTAGDPLAAKRVLAPWMHAMEEGSVERDTDATSLAITIGDRLRAAADERLQAKDWEGAEYWLDQAIDLSATDALARLTKGVVRKRQDDLEGALALMDQAFTLDPENADIGYHRAILRARTGRLREAVEDLDRVVQLQPRHANAYYNRGIAHEKLGEYLRARNDYLLAIRLEPRMKANLDARLKRLERRRSRAAGDGAATKPTSESAIPRSETDPSVRESGDASEDEATDEI